MIAALEGWAKVKHGRGAAKRRSKKAQNEWILAVDAKRKLVEKELEDLDEDEELVLMDSGCGNHACHPKKHFKKFMMRPSAGSRAGQVFTTANEQEIANVGEKVVKFMTREGEQCQITVQCANVSMPIFSTRKLGNTHRSVFADEHRDHGYLEHRVTGHRTHFFSKDGVYFLRIHLTPDISDAVPTEPGFGRLV